MIRYLEYRKYCSEVSRVEFLSSTAKSRWLQSKDSPESAYITNPWKRATGPTPNRDDERASVTSSLSEAEDAVCLPKAKIQNPTFILQASNAALLETHDAGSPS